MHTNRIFKLKCSETACGSLAIGASSNGVDERFPSFRLVPWGSTHASEKRQCKRLRPCQHCSNDRLGVISRWERFHLFFTFHSVLAADTELSMRLSMALVSNYLARQALVQPLGCSVPSDVAVPNTEHKQYSECNEVCTHKLVDDQNENKLGIETE